MDVSVDAGCGAEAVVSKAVNVAATCEAETSGVGVADGRLQARIAIMNSRQARVNRPKCARILPPNSFYYWLVNRSSVLHEKISNFGAY
jgi:hypothetical protein